MIDTTDDDWKQERREEEEIVCILYFILIEKAQRPARIETDSAKKKPRVDPGFKPGPLGQDAIALPLALPPRPE